MTKLRPQSEIINEWQHGDLCPVVSVCCITYNQSMYIHDALKGILNQKTNFCFEILVHDDASTDGTKEILEEYKKQYPLIVKPYFQRENQYQKGVKINWTFNIPRARGEFIAFCEGDDYWVDESKLQLQVDILRKNPSCNMCFHSARQLLVKENKFINTLGPKNINETTIFSPEQLFNIGLSNVPTCAVVCRANFYKDDDVNDFLKIHSTSFFIKFLSSVDGGAFYIPRIMAVYRFGSSGSHNSRVKSDGEFAYEFLEKVNDSFDICNQLTHFKFDKQISSLKLKRVKNHLGLNSFDFSTRLKLYRKYGLKMGLPYIIYVEFLINVRRIKYFWG